PKDETVEARHDHVAPEGHLVGVAEGVDGDPPDPADLLPVVGLGGVDALGPDGGVLPDPPAEDVQPPRGGGQGLELAAVLRRHHVMIISPPDRNVKRILARLEQSALDRLRGWLRLGWGGLDGSELTDAASAPVPRLHPQRLDGHPTLWAAKHGHRSPLRSAS